jgi:hypothetical protein
MAEAVGTMTRSLLTKNHATVYFCCVPACLPPLIFSDAEDETSEGLILSSINFIIELIYIIIDSSFKHHGPGKGSSCRRLGQLWRGVSTLMCHSLGGLFAWVEMVELTGGIVVLKPIRKSLLRMGAMP